MKVFGHFAFAFLAAAGISHAMFYLPAMPEPMASHFGLGGAPDRWDPRAAFFTGTGVVFILITVIFVAVPLLGRRIPRRFIHVPNKEHWLEPDRIDLFWKLFVSRMVWAGNFSLLFVSVVLHLVFLANMKPLPIIDVMPLWTAILVYLFSAVIWVGLLFRRLSKGVGV